MQIIDGPADEERVGRFFTGGRRPATARAGAFASLDLGKSQDLALRIFGGVRESDDEPS